jgi:hypothetical protein
MDFSLGFPLCVLFFDERERDKRYEENDREKKILKQRKAGENVLRLTKNFVITKMKYLPMQRRKKVYIRPNNDPFVKFLDNSHQTHVI